MTNESLTSNRILQRFWVINETDKCIYNLLSNMARGLHTRKPETHTLSSISERCHIATDHNDSEYIANVRPSERTFEYKRCIRSLNLRMCSDHMDTRKTNTCWDHMKA